MSFVPYNQPIDLSNCDREPIHIPGQIQAHGALLVADRSSFVILQVSDNSRTYLGLPPEVLLGTDARALFDASEAGVVERVIADGAVERSPVYALRTVSHGRQPLDVIVHTDGPLLILEFELTPPAEVAAPDFYSFASQVIARLQKTPSTLDYCQALTHAIQEITGYDRVMVYRFGPDWSGHVIAESMRAGLGLAPFLDLHYPASDIPSQARALFLKNTVRMLPSATYRAARVVPELNPTTGEPLDMSRAFLRGASVMYTEYLVNMGVAGTLTLALTAGDKLWGLVACHHYTERQVSYGVRAVCELLARVASLQIAEKVHADAADYRARIQRVHALLLDRLASDSDMAAALLRAASGARDFVDATGVAVVTSASIASAGCVPGEAHLRRLATTLAGRANDTVIAADRLSDIWAEAAQLQDVASGVLAVPLAGAVGEFIMWFRPEYERTVKWAGDPHKPVNIGPLGDRLTPRKSFALWVETVRGCCEPWSELEISAARGLRSSMTELLVSRNRELIRLNQELQRSNEDLDAFAYAASHDLKEPLRGIYNHADLLKRDLEARLAPAEQERIESIVRLVGRMQNLIESLLTYSRLGRGEISADDVALHALVTALVHDLQHRISERPARISVAADLPCVRSNPVFLAHIYENLISNALKYNNRPQIEIVVGWEPAGAAHFPERAVGAAQAFFVRDNGIGIPERHRDAVFRIFKRLHAHDKYGGGTGAGLTIVKKLVERLGGEIWIESTTGVGSTVWFTLGRLGNHPEIHST